MSSRHKVNKRFYIKTLGCKVNQYESEAIRESLTKEGFTESPSKENADICILNTCTVTGEADRESRHLISRFRKISPGAKIVVTGCYVERDSESVASLPGVSTIVKNSEKRHIGKLLAAQLKGGKVHRRRHSSSCALTITDFKDHTKAFVKIQDGCRNFCSYCKVPLVRGVLASKPLDLIYHEVSGLARKGFKEIVLTGICLGAWGSDLGKGRSRNVAGVLKKLNGIKEDIRIRLSSIEPNYVTGELIDLIADSGGRICRHLHIPLQSGDDAILKKMNRPYSAKEYISIVDKARKKIRDVAITTDVMIGFPGESEANFKHTMDVVKRVLPSRTHIFTFSRREGTAAYAMPSDISKETLRSRYLRLKTRAASASYLYRSGFLNKALDILVETERDKLTGLLKGYSDNYIQVLFEGEDGLMRRIVPVTIDYVNLTGTFGAYGTS